MNPLSRVSRAYVAPCFMEYIEETSITTVCKIRGYIEALQVTYNLEHAMFSYLNFVQMHDDPQR